MTVWRFFLEEHHVLNECKVIANNSKKDICGWICSKKLTNVVDQESSPKTTVYKTQRVYREENKPY